MAINSRLRENPALQRMPTSQREWSTWVNEMAKWVLKEAKFGDGSIQTSAGATVSGLDQISGRVPSERSLPMSMVGNYGSAQNTSTLTASDGGSTATITVASHTLTTPSGVVTYNAGSVTGLSYSTAYYVYADDAEFAGGAVTYAATATPTDIVASTARYYVGSITTGVQGTSGNLAGITKASPTTFTMGAVHGWTTGDTVSIASIVDSGPGGDIESTFNGNSYVITVTSTTAFTVAVDSSSLTATWASGGTITRTNTTSSGGGGGGGGGGGTIGGDYVLP